MPAGTGRRRNQPCRPAGIVTAPFLTATAFQSAIDWSSARNSYDAGEISRTAGGRERAVQPPSSDCNGPSVPILKPDWASARMSTVYNTYPIENFSIYLMPKQPAPVYAACQSELLPSVFEEEEDEDEVDITILKMVKNVKDFKQLEVLFSLEITQVQVIKA
ncbi:hypothetical protein PGTUg99_030642 [Puccinia graminis f. sp. tritici]|uniref:Uncharacterized protein n=1 Tax=Puccinia graminis f. sp. tritici TaxID=56615 RepID=A0A5B0PQ58_PUCGR|nr:hypothetical protein PGTUg99_030642 [Puccinia graminis f. sp. tritici]